jgi:hypothetical protein
VKRGRIDADLVSLSRPSRRVSSDQRAGLPSLPFAPPLISTGSLPTTMDPFLFDGYLELEYANYRESTSSLLASSSTSLSPPAVATTISSQQKNRYSPYARVTPQIDNSTQSAMSMTQPIQQQQEAHSAERGDET